MRTCCLAIMLTAALVACDDGTGSYVGTATTVESGVSTDNRVVLYVDKGVDTGVDAVLDGDGLPCSPIALKKSGTRYKQDDDLECRTSSSTTTGAVTTTSTTRTVMKDFDVKITDGSLKISGLWEVSSGTGTSTVTVTDYEFDGERMGK